MCGAAMSLANRGQSLVPAQDSAIAAGDRAVSFRSGRLAGAAAAIAQYVITAPATPAHFSTLSLSAHPAAGSSVMNCPTRASH